MIDERKLDLVVLAALDALDGEDRAAFEALVAKDPEIQREVAAYRELVGRLGTAAAPVPPPAALRERLLRETRPAAAAASRGSRRRSRPRSSRRSAGLVVSSRSATPPAARRLSSARRRRRRARSRRGRRRGRVAARGARDRGRVPRARDPPQSRVVSLAGLPPAPRRTRASCGTPSGARPCCSPRASRRAGGKAYELWIIAKAAPVPAGVFQVDAQGRAVFRLPAGLDFAGVKTFAVTLEPEAGVPAPTGPMVLAGAVS
jgi:anti-sigma-K factor RskA